ncbi:MAG: hypothetical protein ABSH35_03585 [Isosphaeraceae bacterium]
MVEAWPGLPEALKAGIVAMVRASRSWIHSLPGVEWTTTGAAAPTGFPTCSPPASR